MIKPVNSHLIIEPLASDGFMASQHDTYQEIGVVVDVAEDVYPLLFTPSEGNEPKQPVKAGDKVYFDSWMAAKFPKEGSTDEYYWLVKWEDVRAVEVVE